MTYIKVIPEKSYGKKTICIICDGKKRYIHSKNVKESPTHYGLSCEPPKDNDHPYLCDYCDGRGYTYEPINK